MSNSPGYLGSDLPSPVQLDSLFFSFLTDGFRSFSKKTVFLWRYFLFHIDSSVLLLDFKIHSNLLIESSPFTALCMFGSSPVVSLGGYIWESESPRCCPEVHHTAQETGHGRESSAETPGPAWGAPIRTKGALGAGLACQSSIACDAQWGRRPELPILNNKTKLKLLAL